MQEGQRGCNRYYQTDETVIAVSKCLVTHHRVKISHLVRQCRSTPVVDDFTVNSKSTEGDSQNVTSIKSSTIRDRVIANLDNTRFHHIASAYSQIQ